MRLILLLAAGLAAAAPAQDPAPPEPKKPEAPAAKPQDAGKSKLEPIAVGAKLPKGFALRDLDGKEQKFDDLHGKVVVLHFWSDRCPAEVNAEPKLNALAKEFADKGVVVLGIAANANEIGEKPAESAFAAKDEKERPYGNLRSKAKESAVNHAILVDHGAVLGRLLDAKTTPHCFVVDKEGTLAYGGALDDDGGNKKGDKATQHVRDAVQALLAGEKVALATTKPYG